MVIQPEVNIGLVGHVDSGKTSITYTLSGKWADTHSEELKRGITIRLGYADIDIYETKNGLSVKKSKDAKLKRRISIVDAPGHESLMATMLSGATIMDGAILVISANDKCPQPQTREHLMALQIMGVKNVVVAQNKIDLVDIERAKESYEEIKQFLKDTNYKDAPIIPISASAGVNIKYLLEAIEEHIPTPKRDLKKDPLMYVARSFDINKPGSDPSKILGGVLGGALQQGKFKDGDEIEIKPGLIKEVRNQKVAVPIRTKIVGLKTGGKSVKEVIPGGSIGILTSLDPAIVKSDTLTGSVVGIPGKLPETLWNFTLETHLLERMVGSQEDIDVAPIKLNEPIMLNVNSAATVGVVTKLGKNKIDCILKLPVCADKGDRVTISRRVGNRFRLIGYGIIQ